MQFYRLYAGDDGQSHFEALDSSKTRSYFNKTRDAKGLLFETTSRRISSTITARLIGAG